MPHSATVAEPQVIAAGLILRRETVKGDRWLLLKARKHREWGFPKGHQEPGESLVATALRECAEETGIALVAFDGPQRELIHRVGDGRLKRVVYFPALTATSAVQLSHEHVAADWMDGDAVIERLAHDNLRALFASYLAARRR